MKIDVNAKDLQRVIDIAWEGNSARNLLRDTKAIKSIEIAFNKAQNDSYMIGYDLERQSINNRRKQNEI